MRTLFVALLGLLLCGCEASKSQNLDGLPTGAAALCEYKNCEGEALERKGCPDRPPTLESGCKGEAYNCFYCEGDRKEYLADEFPFLYRCEDDKWAARRSGVLCGGLIGE